MVPSSASIPPSSPASTEQRGPGREIPGWHSRGYLPHFDSLDVVQHVTFHLADSLPEDAVERLRAEIQQLDPEKRDIEKRRRFEAIVDAGHGACWLRRPDCARIIQEALLHFDGERYRIIAWVVMPNHVHVLFQTLAGWSMSTVVSSWKTFTANAVGRLIRQPGQPLPHVWHPEFWDRYIRDATHLARAVAYIHNNPVKAGLVSRPEDWPWTSALPPETPERTGSVPALPPANTQPSRPL